MIDADDRKNLTSNLKKIKSYIHTSKGVKQIEPLSMISFDNLEYTEAAQNAERFNILLQQRRSFQECFSYSLDIKPSATSSISKNKYSVNSKPAVIPPNLKWIGGSLLFGIGMFALKSLMAKNTSHSETLSAITQAQITPP